MNRSRLLMIEGDCTLRTMIERHLADLDRFEVEVADDAEAGVERSRLGRFDIVLASLHLSDMTPARLLESLASVRPPPVVIAIARPERAESLSAKRAASIWEVLALPFTRAELTDVVLRATMHHEAMSCRTIVPLAKKTRHRKGSSGTRRRKGTSRPVRLGHYEVVELLGGGAKGTVYHGLDKRNNEDVALRAIPRGLVERLDAGSRWFERFTREASTAAAINHPNLSAVIDHGFEEDQRCLFVVSEFVDGTRLVDLLKEGALPPARSITVAWHVSKALAAVHAGGFAHRMIRPSNIFIKEEDVAVVTDLGVANMLGWDLMPLRPRLDHVPYLSPEQVRFGRVDDRSDQFSLGLVLHKMLTGRHVFKGRSPSGKIHEMMRAPLKFSLPKDMEARTVLSELLERMLAPEPEERFQGDIELKAALKNCGEELGVEL